MSPLVIIALVVLSLILFIAIVVAYNVWRTPPTNAYITCERGKCATSIFNGDKRCPTSGDHIIVRDPAREVCNSKYRCNNQVTPYALLSDGSTSVFGCEEGEVCRCLREPRCPSYTTTYFKIVNDTLHSQGSRALIRQYPLDHPGYNQPVTYRDSGRELCELPPIYLSRLSPNPCVFDDPYNPTLDEIGHCMENRPCISGALAFIADGRKSPDELIRHKLSCVKGEVRKGIAIWDTSQGRIIHMMK